MTGNRRPAAGAAVLRGEITSAIRAAVVQELAAVGYGRLSMEAVARRAGVGKAAIYRRWSSKLELVLEIVSSAVGPALPVPDTGSLRGDIELVLRVAAKALRHPLASQIIPDLLAEAARNEQIEQTLRATLRANQRGIGEQLIDRAVRRGEMAAGMDPDEVVDLVVGPLYWRVTVARTPLPGDYLSRMAAIVASAITAGQPLPAGQDVGVGV